MLAPKTLDRFLLLFFYLAEFLVIFAKFMLTMIILLLFLNFLAEKNGISLYEVQKPFYGNTNILAFLKLIIFTYCASFLWWCDIFWRVAKQNLENPNWGMGLEK